MPVKKLNPTTPGRRQMTIADFSGLSKKPQERSLLRGKKRISGRNNAGRVTIRHRGGGHKRLERIIDFKRTDKAGVPATVKAIEYDPNRTAYIALLFYADGDKRYMIAPEGLKVGDAVVCNDRTRAKLGNRMQLQNIPQGFKIYDIQLQLGRGGVAVRSAGASATLVGFDEKYAIVQMPSSEMRKINKECYATIGTVSNSEHNLIVIGKAGRKRWLGKKPEVLGKSMNPVDHPHGGGEGHAPIGRSAPRTPWGKLALGVKTRAVKKTSNRLIVRRRVSKRRKR
jgi:large subunit ribosomal protein L2